MTTPTNNQLPPASQRRLSPQALATAVGDWVRAILVVVAWLVAIAVACAAAYFVIRSIIFLINLAHVAFGL